MRAAVDPRRSISCQQRLLLLLLYALNSNSIHLSLSVRLLLFRSLPKGHTPKLRRIDCPRIMEMTLSALVTYSSSHRISLGICLCKFSTRIPPRQFNFSPRVETIPTEPFFSNLINSRASARHCLLSFNTNCTALFPANSPQCHAFVRCCPEIHSRKGWTIYFNKAIKGN